MTYQGARQAYHVYDAVGDDTLASFGLSIDANLDTEILPDIFYTLDSTADDFDVEADGRYLFEVQYAIYPPSGSGAWHSGIHAQARKNGTSITNAIGHIGPTSDKTSITFAGHFSFVEDCVAGDTIDVLFGYNVSTPGNDFKTEQYAYKITARALR